ncbi:MAG: hypothetical protein NT126_11220 [Bacteroidetes bacterium]|nr:hypothetical protein [Bacteroidota bacterium]
MISEVAEGGALKSLSRINPEQRRGVNPEQRRGVNPEQRRGVNPEQRRGIWSIPRSSAAENEIHIDTSQLAAGSFIC